MRFALVPVTFVAVLALGGTALQAAPILPPDPVLPGDIVTLQDGPGSGNGGEFKMFVDAADWIETFCIQQTEYINFGSPFVIDTITQFAISDPLEKGGVGGLDPISPQTAFLYTNFRAHTLAGYDYSLPGREASAANLQLALWTLENEMSTPIPAAAQAFIDLANASGWTDIGQVRVANLKYANGVEAQDQLVIMPVPEPGTILLLGIGFALVAARRRFS